MALEIRVSTNRLDSEGRVITEQLIDLGLSGDGQVFMRTKDKDGKIHEQRGGLGAASEHQGGKILDKLHNMFNVANFRRGGEIGETIELSGEVGEKYLKIIEAEKSYRPPVADED